NIIICAKSDLEGLQNTKRLVENEGVSCYIGLCDVTNEDSVKEFISDSAKAIGKTDILINNAGISYIGLLQDMSLEDWNKVLNTNLTSAFLMSKYVIPEMLKKQSGHIINISSVWGNIGASMEVAYSASKGGINSFTKALAKELAPSNISVNSISPGFIDTDMNKVFEKDELDAIFEEIPMGRAGSPSEVAKLIYKIAMSDYITGQVITIDGGWT
ncbi:MAG: SDR family oxidoreductase, partial [Lachnoanaerobaculum sp.]|nr:SDR family oxidoreductase [Lachnoanaerobaculum sp.]